MKLVKAFVGAAILVLAIGCGGSDDTAGGGGPGVGGSTGGTGGTAGTGGAGASAGSGGQGTGGSAGSLPTCPDIPADAIRVTDNTALMAALDGASGGETIVLEDGDYGEAAIADKTYTDHVTVMAENVREAVFSKIEISNVHYLRVCGVKTTGGREGVLIEGGSSYVEILASEFYNSSAMFDRNDPHHTQVSQLYGLQANDGSNNLLIENNYAHDIQSSGFVFFGVSDIVVRGNEADWLQSDGFKFAGVTNALVENNTGMREVHSSPEAHVDFMQAQGDMSDSMFRGNVALMDTRSFQGLFFGGGTFENIQFEQNVIYTGHTRGISVDCATCEATHNTVLAAEENGTFLVHKQVTIHGVGTTGNNVTSTYIGQSGISGTDHRLQYEDSSSDYFYDDYYENATAGPGLTIQDLRPVAGSPADGQVGAYDRINALLGP